MDRRGAFLRVRSRDERGVDARWWISALTLVQARLVLVLGDLRWNTPIVRPFERRRRSAGPKRVALHEPGLVVRRPTMRTPLRSSEEIVDERADAGHERSAFGLSSSKRGGAENARGRATFSIRARASTRVSSWGGLRKISDAAISEPQPSNPSAPRHFFAVEETPAAVTRQNTPRDAPASLTTALARLDQLRWAKRRHPPRPPTTRRADGGDGVFARRRRRPGDDRVSGSSKILLTSRLRRHRLRRRNRVAAVSDVRRRVRRRRGARDIEPRRR